MRTFRRAITAALSVAVIAPAAASAQIPVTLPGVPSASLPTPGKVVENPHPLLPSVRACPNALNGAASASVQRKAVACLINKIRAKKGLRRLRTNRKLNNSAALKRIRMVKCKQFSHSPCGDKLAVPFKRSGYISGYGRWSIGENLAWGSQMKGTPLSIVNGWLRSRKHRENILKASWREQGLSMRWHSNWQGVDSAAVWVSHFAVRR